MKWQLQQAKSRLSQVVNDALSDGPQVITRHGVETAVLLSYEDYRRLRPPEGDLVEFLSRSPFREDELELERSKDLGRDVEI